MKPSTWADALHTWGLVVLCIIIFLLLAGVPFGLRGIC